MMLDRGSLKQDKFAIAQRLESVGASISFNVENQTVDIRARCLAKDLPLVVELIAEQLRQPAFQVEEFERVRQQFVGAVRGSIDNSSYRARDAFNRALFPTGHPNRPLSIDQLLQSARSATLAQVKAFHGAHYGSANLILVFVGDVRESVVRRSVKRAFDGWSGGLAPLTSAAAARVAAPTQTQTVVLEGKPSVSILLGQTTGLRYRDPDTLALRVGTAVLGTGFTGRLMSTVRDKEGLTYGIGAGISDDTYNDGAFGISATFAPQLLDKGLESTRRELRKWWTDGIRAEELAERKQSLVGTYQVGLSTTGGMAGALLSTAQRGLDLTWLDRYPDAVRALTLDQVNAAIRKYLDPDKMVLVEVGTLPGNSKP
jgi:zinc protease